jgi:putative ABC transport system ATP-binding protein
MVESKPMIEIRDLRKSFVSDDGSSVQALRGVTLNIGAGDFVTFMGPNGAAKTTLLRCIVGELHADQGEIILHGTKKNAHCNGAFKSMPYVPQNPSALAFPEMTIEEHMLVAEQRNSPARFWRRGVTRERRQRYEAFLLRYGAETLAERLGQPLRSFSGGWQQVFVILMVVATLELGTANGAERILILDEPVSNLDAVNTGRCVDLIRRLHREGYTILLATHDVDLALNASQRLCIMRQGVVIADLSTDEAKRQGMAAVVEMLQGRSVALGDAARKEEAGAAVQSE